MRPAFAGLTTPLWCGQDNIDFCLRHNTLAKHETNAHIAVNAGLGGGAHRLTTARKRSTKPQCTYDPAK